MWPLLVAGLVLLMLGTAGGALAYVGGKPVAIELTDIGDGFRLRNDAAQAFLAMRTRAAYDGRKLYVNSAFRTMEEQEELHSRYEDGTGNLAAKPGFSNHQGGIAVDIDVDGSFFSPTYQWLAANARAFGFVNTGAGFSQKEPWHWEFRGLS